MKKKILLFGEPLIRVMPLDVQQIDNQTLSKIYFGGSEVNIARTLQGFGLDTEFLTGLPDSNIGERFLAFLKRNSIGTNHIHRIGKRIGIYYLENGFGCRQSNVFYDRSHTSISELKAEMIDVDKLFDGIVHFHFSGITIAINEEIRKLLLLLLDEAKKRNITISLDLNWRSKMISALEAKKLFSVFAHYADYCFGIEPIMINEQDLKLFNRHNARVESIEERMATLQKIYQFKVIFHTIRQTDEQGNNLYSAYGLTNTFQKSIELKTKVLQRVGSGDAFIAGALYQLIQGASLQKTLDFAIASGTLKCTFEEDSMFQSVKAIEALGASSKDIIR